jgi:hypothetical protein
MDHKVAAGLVRSAGTAPTTPQTGPNPMRGLIPEPPPAPRIHGETAAKEAADLKQGERMKLAKEGKALPDGSFPIRNAADLEKARIRLHQASDPAMAKAHIMQRAKALGVKMPPGY